MSELSPLRGVACAADVPRARALALAHALQLPLLEDEAAAEGLVLRISLAGLELADPRPRAPGAVRVDFSRLALHRGGSVRGESVARAVGLRGGQPLTVVDATAGLGRDAFVLASLGARVHLIERSPVVAALLADGIGRALADPETAEAAGRMTLHAGEAAELLPSLCQQVTPEAVYLDPMYPEAGTKGEVKKEMQLLRRLLGPDPDIAGLFATALGCARRVVVKRPRRAPALPGAKPNHVLEGRSTRFDVYLSAHKSD